MPAELGACPLDCPDTCGWVVDVRDGRAVSLRGNPDHPFTRGSLCVKVNRYLEHTASPDRLLHPLRRTGPKGAGTFERITWDEALDEIAARLRGIIDEYGGEAVWPYWGTGSLGYLQGLDGPATGRFFKAIGAAAHDMTICSTAGSAGLTYLLGTSATIDPEDLAHSKLIILWGTNTLTSGHHLWGFIQQARAAGAHLVAIDPVRTRTAAQADEHLAPVPGTDAALALGLANLMVSMGAHDRDFTERHTLGWEAFADRIAEFPPGRVAAITGLPVEQIMALATRIATIRPTAIRATMGLQRHAGGGAALRALAALPAVTGDWALPGGGLSYSTGRHYNLDLATLNGGNVARKPVRTLSLTRLGEHLTRQDDPPVKALFVIAANPVTSAPHQNLIRGGLAREDLFTVVLEHFRTDTVDYADLVLPATMQTEHADLHTGYGHLYLAWNTPAVAPPGECLSTTETFRLLAARMGLDEPGLYDSDEQLAEQALGSGHPWLDGITLDRLRADGFARLNVPRPFLPFADRFPTPSGRLELYSQRAADDGLDPLPGFVPAAEVCDPVLAERYPLALVSAAGHHFLNSIFGNNAELRRRAGQPRILLHPDDAAARNLPAGAAATVHNDRGAFTAIVEITDAVRPGVAATIKGHWAKLTGGSSVNATVDERDADLGGGAVFHDNRVEVTATPAG
jgi:anaerobic selenocysteine-containing dehydrogenase